MAINCGALSTFLIFFGAVAVGISLVTMPEDLPFASIFDVRASLKVKPLGDCDFCIKLEGLEQCEG
jgi:hypothetical protein